MARYGDAFTIVNHVLQSVEDWVEVQTGKHKVLVVVAQDHLRLLRLHLWSLRYQVPIAEILDLIVPTLRQQVKKRASNALGLPMKVLIGKASHNILRYQLKQRYPQAEHVLAWQESVRAKQLAAEDNERFDGVAKKFPKVPDLLLSDSVEDYVGAYHRNIEYQRKLERKVLNQSWRRRKNYRWNPWL